jgi:tetratricopeptide (TPR) repeat protein
MKRHGLYVLVLLMAGSAAVRAASPAAQLAGAKRPDQEKAPASAAAGKSARPKTATVGADLAETRSPALAAAVSSYSASPTVREEVELAHAYYGVGILDQAFDHYEAAARRQPREAAAWDGLARVWRDWGYPGLGLADAHRAVFADPSSPMARNTLGTILQLLGKSQEASEQFTRAVGLDPGAAYAHYNLALARMTLGRWAEAADAFERAATLDPTLDAARARAREAKQQAFDAAAAKGGIHERR